MRRRAALITTAAGLAVLGTTPAEAHHSPAGCTSNSVELLVTKSRTLVRNGDTINYRVEVANDSGSPCDLTDTTVTLILPAADGSPTGRRVVLDSDADYLAGMGNRVLGTIPYTVAVNPGVEDAVVEARVNGTLHDAPADHAARITKTLGTTVTQPHATLVKTASVDRGQAPLTVTYNYLLTNDSTTNAPISGATVTDDKCAPLVHRGGDTDGDRLIDVGEAWTFACTQTFDTAQTVINTAVATGRNTVDGLPVPINPAQATVRVDAPPAPPTPPGGSTLPGDSTPPVTHTGPGSPGAPTPGASSPAPTPAAGGVQGRTFKLVPVKSRQASKDAPCVSVPKRLAVRAGELTTVRVRVRKEPGHSLVGAVVRVTGPGFVDAKRTDSKGEVTFQVRSKRAGTLVIQSNRCLGADRVAVRSARRTISRRVPRVTG